MASVHDLIDHLTRPGTIPAGELRDALGVSPATLSRLVAAAGEAVVRLGRARAVEYARTREIEGVGREAPVFRVGEDGSPRRIGRLVFLWDGATWFERGSGGRRFVGLPPAFADMAPQGYLGSGFSARFPELRLPARIASWSDDHRLRALALRGEDTVGDLLVGSESLARFLAGSQREVEPASFPGLAQRSALDASGSSAGGERPKFGALSGGRHVLVKFAPPDDAPVARRWRDLLWCECRALRLVREAGFAAAAEAALRDVEGWRFLETDRFDRVGLRGRRSVLTLEAIANEYLGDRESWTAAARRLERSRAVDDCPFTLPAPEAARLCWLDAFGQLIGNTDRHFGNVSFFVSDDGELRLTEAYDVLPMVLAPAAETLVERPFHPAPPVADALDEWRSAAPWAVRYWRELSAEPSLHEAVRERARGAADAVERLARVVMPSEWDRAYAVARRPGTPS